MKKLIIFSMAVILMMASWGITFAENSDAEQTTNSESAEQQILTQESTSCEDTNSDTSRFEAPFTCGNTTGGEKLYHYGFIKGSGDSSTKIITKIIMEDKVLTRAQLAIIITQLTGTYEEASAFAGEPEYLDAAAIPNWAKNYIAYVQQKKWMIGGNDIFNSNGGVTQKQLLAVILRALGYEDIAWTDIMQKADSLDLVILSDESEAKDAYLTRGVAFEIIWKAVTTPIASDGGILGVKTGHLE